MPEPSRRILAFEPWDAGSHAAVRRSIERHSVHRWTWITLPGRGHRWRLRTGAWRLAEAAATLASDASPDAPWDVVVASGLVDLAALDAALRRLVPPSCWSTPLRVPWVLVMHENQAAYPAGETGADPRDAHLIATNDASLRRADVVLWNSAWNQRSCLDGIAALRRHDPDPPVAWWADGQGAWGPDQHVWWPPVERDPTVADCPSGSPTQSPDSDASDAHESARDPVRVVWPHRWEHDKGPDRLLALADDIRADRNAAEAAGRPCRWPPIRWVILGERFARVPPEMQTFLERHAADIEHAGHVASIDAYRGWLRRCDWVLSTARHEFFGIAVVEALLAGCLPWLPDELSYPELVPDIARGLRPDETVENPGAVRAAIAAHLAPAVAEHSVARLDEWLAGARPKAAPRAHEPEATSVGRAPDA